VTPARTRFKGADNNDDDERDYESGNAAPPDGCADAVGAQDEEDSSNEDESFSSDRSSTGSRLSGSTRKGSYVHFLNRLSHNKSDVISLNFVVNRMIFSYEIIQDNIVVKLLRQLQLGCNLFCIMLEKLTEQKCV